MNRPTVKFVFWHDGDSSTGIGGDSATVEMESYPFDGQNDPKGEWKQMFLDAMRKTFQDFWDFEVYCEEEDNVG